MKETTRFSCNPSGIWVPFHHVECMPGRSVKFSGDVTPMVVENGRVIKTFPTIKNLILNQGLDYYASYPIFSCIAYGVVGTGVAATAVESSGDTVSVSSGNLTASEPRVLTGTSADVGRVFKVGSTNYTVAEFGTTTACIVSPNTNVGASAYQFYYTNQIGLSAEVKRTSTIVPGAAFSYVSSSGGTITIVKTYDFSIESSPISYNEVGFSPLANAGNNLFSRLKFPTTVDLLAGQLIRVKYSLTYTVSPITPENYAVSPITNWPTATGTLQHIAIPIPYIDTTNGGVTTAGINPVDNNYHCGIVEPSVAGVTFYLSNDSRAHGAYGTQMLTDNSTWYSAASGVTLSVYEQGTYYRSRQCTYAVLEANASNLRSYFVGYSYYSTWMAVRYLMDSNQTKVATYTLTLGFTTTWGRII